MQRAPSTICFACRPVAKPGPPPCRRPNARPASALLQSPTSRASCMALSGTQEHGADMGADGSSVTGAPRPPSGGSYGAFNKQGVYTTLMDVRDYEMDQFGVVNNAVYASYVQHARHEAFNALGFSMDSFTQAGSALALSSLSLTFLAPLRSRDKFEVTVWVEKITAARLVLGQQIALVSSPPGPSVATGGAPARAPGQMVLKAEAVVVFLDAAYQPVRVPAAVREAFGVIAEQWQRSRQQGPDTK